MTAMKYCKNCNKELMPTMLLCPSCGNREFVEEPNSTVSSQTNQNNNNANANAQAITQDPNSQTNYSNSVAPNPTDSFVPASYTTGFFATMFTAKITDEQVNMVCSFIILTYTKAFNEDKVRKASSELSQEAETFCLNYLQHVRDRFTIGFDAKRKKEAKKIATEALYKIDIEFKVQERMDDPDYSYLRQLLAKATRHILIDGLDAGSSVIYEDTLGVIVKSPAAREPLLDSTHEFHQASATIFKASCFELKKRLKAKGVFKGPIHV